MKHSEFLRDRHPEMKSLTKIKSMENIPSKFLHRKEIFMGAKNRFTVRERDIKLFSPKTIRLQVNNKSSGHEKVGLQIFESEFAIARSADIFTLQDLQSFQVLWEFLDSKPKNCAIIHSDPNFSLQLKFRNNELFGAKCRK